MVLDPTSRPISLNTRPYDPPVADPTRFGLRKDFLEEGTFKARVLADDEEFPIPDAIDVSDIEVPVRFFCCRPLSARRLSLFPPP